MPTGAITPYIDVAQLVLYAFWVFFAGLIYYLHGENKREGYPLEDEASGRATSEGFPPMPAPKTYLLRTGQTVTTPRPQRETVTAAQPFARHIGSPLVPTGNPMLDGIGPGAYAQRADAPDLTYDNKTRIVPLRIAGSNFGINAEDIDPRGLRVIGVDGVAGGTVREMWVDRAEILFRYLEVEVDGGGTVMLPSGFARIKQRYVQVDSITGAQFAAVPKIASPDQITLLEEEKVMAYYGGGTLYATAGRSEPLL